MPSFLSTDGTRLAYHSTGSGDPLIVLPGGPMRSSEYLGDLGGLAAHRTLHLLDLRGTGASGVPADPGSYRCDRQAGDIEAFREQLGLERVDILAHSAGASLALLYAARRPERVSSLTLVAPGLGALGCQATEDALREAAELRSGQPWFAEAKAAFEEVLAGRMTEENRQAVMPFFFGRWDAAARAVAEASTEQRNHEAAAVFEAEGAYDPPATRAALAKLSAPVLVLAGEMDGHPRPAKAREVAALFPNGRSAVLPGGGHYPWMDDAQEFVRLVTGSERRGTGH